MNALTKFSVLLLLLLVAVGCTESADVMHTKPAAGARNVSTEADITVSFSRTMKPESVTVDSFIVAGTYYGKRYPGTISADEDARTYTFSVGQREGAAAGAGYLPGEKVVVRLTKDIVGADNIPFEGYRFSFIVEGDLPELYTGPLQVIDAEPANGRSGVPVGTPVSVEFNRSVTQSSVTSNFRVFGRWTGLRTGTISFTGGTGDLARGAVFAPDDPFLPGETVTATLSNGVTGSDPADTLQPYSCTFTLASGSSVMPWVGDQIASGLHAAAVAGGDFRLSLHGLEGAILDSDGAVYLCAPRGSAQRLSNPYGDSIGSLAAGDIMAAGEVLLLAADRAASSTVLRFLGAEGFTGIGEKEDPVIIAGRYDASMAVADFDGDADLDVIMGGPSGLIMVAREGEVIPPELLGLPGMDTVGPTIDVKDVGLPRIADVDYLHAADLNGDGRMDLLVRRGSELGAVMAETDGFGGYQAVTSLGEHGNATPIYLDGETACNVAVMWFEPAAALAVFAHDGDRLSEKYVIDSAVPLPTAGRVQLLAHDLTADGVPEIVMGAPSWDALYTVFPVEAGGRFNATIEASAAPGTNALTTVDYDADGFLELFVASADGVWVFDTADGVPPATATELRITSEQVAYEEDGVVSLTVRGRSSFDFDCVRVGLVYDAEELELLHVTFPLDGFFNAQKAEITTYSSTDGTNEKVIATLATNDPFDIHREVDLITFTFRFHELTGSSTVVRLENGLVDSENTTVDNAFRLAGQETWIDAGLFEREVTLEGEPELLLVTCTLVVAEDGHSATAAIAWESPLGHPLPDVTVLRNEALVHTASGPGSWTDTSVEFGPNRYNVIVRDQGQFVASQACSLTFVASPVMEACRVESGELLVRWSALGAVDGFHLFRDSTDSPYRTFGPEQTEYREPDNISGAGHLFGVSAYLGQEQSLISFCDAVIGGGDGKVQPPVEFTAAVAGGDPFAIDLSWRQGQGYEQLAIFRNTTRIDTVSLVTSYRDVPVVPGTHTYTLRPITRGELGSPVTAGPVTVTLPLSSTVSCQIAGSAQVLVTWTNESLVYDHFNYEGQILRRTRITPEGLEVEPENIHVEHDAASYVDTVGASAGEYKYVLFARYGGNLRPSASLAPSCTVRFATSVYPVSIRTGANLVDIALPVKANLVGAADEVRFRYRYAGGGDPGESADRLKITGVKPGPGVTVESSDPTSTDGTWYAIDVRIQGPVGPGEGILLCEFLATTVADFQLYGYGQEPPDVAKRMVPVKLVEIRVDYPGEPLVTLDVVEDTVEVSCRYMMAQSLSGVVPGEIFSMPVLGTFDKGLMSFNIAFSFDQNALEAVSQTIADTETPPGLVDELANFDNETGVGVILWIANPEPLVTLPAGYHRLMAYLQFRATGSSGPGEEVRIEPITIDGVHHKPMLFQEGWAEGQFLEHTIGANVDIVAPPEISQITPDEGPLLGGNRLEIQGANFGSPAPLVRIRGRAAEVLQHDNELLLCRVPPLEYSVRPTGPVTASISVRNDSGTDTATEAYRYVLLNLTTTQPDSGPLSGGQQVRITGRGIDQTVEVFFSGAPAQVLSVDQIEGAYVVATAPAMATPGPVDIKVQSSDGQVDVLTDGYTYVADAPVLHSVTPSSGPTTGGTLVQIEGEYLVGVTAVTFGANDAVSFTEVSAQLLEAVSPPGEAGEVLLVVRTQAGVASEFFHYVAPAFAITDFAPRRGTHLGGTAVIVSGRNFEQDMAVFFGGVPAPMVMVQSQTALLAETPAGSGEVTITAELSGGDQAEAPAPFTYVAGAATITDFSPRMGPAGGGNTIQIAGSNFIPETTVLIGGTEVPSTGVTYVSERTLRAVMPPGTGSVSVAVANPGTAPQQAAVSYTYQIATATVTSFNPTRGSRFGDTVVRLEGSGFFALTRVFFGGQEIPAGRITVVSDSMLEVMTTPHTPGAVSVAVQNPDAAQVLAAGEYVYEMFSLTQASPASSSMCGGAEILLAGTSLHHGVVIRFGPHEAQLVSMISEYELLAYTPSVPEGTGQIRITASYGGLQAQGPDFTFGGAQFVRGDANGNGAVTRDDAERLLQFLHGISILGAPIDAADVDDNGIINVSDAWYLMGHLVATGPPPPPPFPLPGEDPTPDGLHGCAGP